jgi:ubiquinone/menaquinone biosynthesis C-methylase UbiE
MSGATLLPQAYGEDLGQFEADSFDAVIITLVLCSVSSVQETLREVRSRF